MNLSIDPSTNNCFGCSPSNPIGLHLHFVIATSPTGVLTTTSQVRLSELYEGGQGNLHGGIIATLLDEAMSKLNKPLGVGAVTRHMEVDYLRPSPVDKPLTLVGRHLRSEGRKLFHVAELLNRDHEVLAQAKAIFVVVERSAG